jgi:3-methyladenine DNA glycosylase/8-oxoguanine DNA glycosylase
VTTSATDDPHTVLSQRDKTLAALIERHGPAPRRRAARASDRFASLAEIIVYQQLAGRAAATIHGRFVGVLGNDVTPERVLAASPEALASAGLSGAKAASIRDLADKVVTGQVSLERIGRLSDDAVVDHLTRVRGIGPWTADMFLLDTLGRLDVWPTGDYGVRAGFAAAWGLAEVPTAKELMVLGEPFRPYRSLVAWYCWRVVDDRSASN